MLYPARFSGLVILALSLLGAASAATTRIMERLDRGVVAVHQPDGKVFVSWRLLASDPEGAAFNLYRETAPAVSVAFGNAPRMREEPVVKLNTAPLTGATWFLDPGARLERATKYFVRAVVNGTE